MSKRAKVRETFVSRVHLMGTYAVICLPRLDPEKVKIFIGDRVRVTVQRIERKENRRG